MIVKLVQVARYRYFHAPELSAHLARHLQGDLCGHGHQSLRTAQCARYDTLAGDGTVHAEELLHVVVFVLPVGGQHHHHLTTKRLQGSSRTPGGQLEKCKKSNVIKKYIPSGSLVSSEQKSHTSISSLHNHKSGCEFVSAVH